MRTLIVHPKDSTTTFLEKIYKSIPEKKVIDGGVSKIELIEKMEEYDRVMMMGHGSPFGLFNMNLFKDNGGYIIDHSFVPTLSKKNNSVYIWCNADKFVEKFKLKGFYSGMFISEVGEAYICGVHNVNQEIVDESNYGFSEILSEVINENHQVVYNHVMNRYGEIAKNNVVASYNFNRLYLSV
jgi:hypothetical protein